MKKIDILWHGLNSANKHLSFKEEMTGLPCDLFTTLEMIDSAAGDKNFMLELTSAEKTSTKSDVGRRTPPWRRQFLNINSNNDFRKYGIVENVCYEALNGHMRMLPLGRSIDSKEKLIELIDKVDNTKDVEIPDTQMLAYHKPSKVSKATTKTVTTYPPATPANKKYLLARSEGKCEMCCKSFILNEKGDGLVFNAHHIYDPKSTSEAVISKERREHVNDMAAVCGGCHEHIHRGIDGYNHNIKLRTKIKAVNELMEWGEVKQAAAARMEIIIKRE